MEQQNKNNTYNTLFHFENFQLRLIFEGIAVGMMTSIIIVLYRLLAEKIWKLNENNFIHQSHNLKYIIFALIIYIILSLIVGHFVKKEPMISGSGIPQTEGVLTRKLEMNWIKVLVGKFFGGAICIGAGLSVGREGPSIQMGGAIGQGVSRIFKRVKIEERFLITSGASAGIAAAFNAPLAGIVFALEEVHKNFSSLVLISAMGASLTADFVSKQFFGLKPVFDLHLVKILPLKYYALLIILGIVTGILGVVFNKSIIKSQDLYSKIKILKNEYKPVIPFVVALLLAIIFPKALGSGHDLILQFTEINFGLKALVILLIIKFIFTMVCYGSGVPGGIFLPLLVIGAIIGNIYGTAFVKIFNMDSQYVLNFIVLAMAGYFTAIVRAPITGIILITEMTGSFSHILPLIVVSITAYIVADILRCEPIYETLLHRLLSKNEGKIQENTPMKHKKTIIEVAVCLGSTLDNKKIKQISWPQDCLLVAIKRGHKEIIPKGNTIIYTGDYLIVLTNEEKASEISERLLEIAGVCSLNSDLLNSGI